ncbi:MAG TPA: hypothetical protein VF585_08210 [Chthoniobacterales bacterium]|jgi:hypothetical protein
MKYNLPLLALSIALVSTAVSQTVSTQVEKTKTTSVEQSPTQATVAVQSTEKSRTSTGTLSGVDPSQLTLTLSSPESASPLRFNYSDETKFFDGEGQALTPEALESGSDVKLTYVQAGTTLIAVKAVVSKPEPAPVVATEQVVVTPPPAVVVERVVVTKPTPSPVLEEETTTTTTTNTP